VTFFGRMVADAVHAVENEYDYSIHWSTAGSAPLHL